MAPPKYISTKLIARLRREGILPGSPAELVRIDRGGSRDRVQWRWYARNPYNRVSYRVGSPHPMEELLDAELATRRDSRGVTVVIAGTRPKPKTKGEQLRAESCDECGAPAGQYCLFGGVPSRKTVHASRLRKLHQGH